MKRPGRSRIALRILGFLALAACQAFALSPDLSVRQYLHSSWTEIDGKPFPEIYHLAQGVDGYLWLGSGSGLLRFDGIRFSTGLAAPRKLPGSVFYGLIASARGGLWVATENGVTRVQDGALRTYPPGAGGRKVRDLLEDPAGDLWVLLADRETAAVEVLSAKDGSIRRFDQRDGLPPRPADAMAADLDSFWLGTHDGLCRWRPGTPAACRPVPETVISLFRDRPDSVFAAGVRTIVHSSQGALETLAPMLSGAAVQRNGLMVDRGGNLWVATTGGLLRIQSGKVERFTRKDGLSGDAVTAILEDREGDVWVATNGGIDRFRNPRVLHLTTLDGLSGDAALLVQSARDGSTWVGAGRNGVNRVMDGTVKTYSVVDGLPGGLIFALYEDAMGRLWLAEGGYLGYFQNGRFRTVAARDGTPIGPVYGIGGDAQGTVWAAAERHGLWRVRNDVAEPVGATALKDLFRVMASRDGLLWAGSFGQGVVTISGSSQTAVFGPTSGIGPGPPRALYEDPAGAVWVGAGSTLTRFRNGKPTTWSPREGFPDGEIYGIAGDARDSLWIVTATAVLRAASADLDRVPDGASQAIRLTQYDSRDGLRLEVRGGMGSPRISAATDGRIWVSERDGVAMLDPDLLRPNTIAPPVSIEDLTVDGRPLDRSRLSFRGRALRIAYTGLSLTAPERVHFRYRLDPVDQAWTDADVRREVTLVNLSPGSYRFRVAAANLDGVWNEAGAVVDFRVEPYFTQTIWFKLSLAAALGMFAWMIYHLRLRQMRSRFHLVAQERARVTREIHDSLLQGFAGVVYQLYAVSRQFDSDPKGSKEKLDRALDQADESLREARQMLMDMRLPVLEDSTLAEALASVGAKATRETSTVFHLKTRGPVAPLPYAAQAAMFLIGREAINNAVNHAQAGRITVQLIYSEKQVAMTVQDDGLGFDLAAAGRKDGHFGVRSMGERARQVGAGFRVNTAPGRGTKIEVSVPRKKTAG